MAGVLSVVAVLVSDRAAAAEGISSNALQQIQALQLEKQSRTPAQRKMDSQLIYAVRLAQNQPVAPGVPSLVLGTQPQPDGKYLVDIDATVNPDLTAAIVQAGGVVVNSSPRFGQIRARLPIDQIELLAARGDVRFIRPAVECISQIGSLTSEGDTTHAAATGRDIFRVDGTGVKVGVLSDSVDYLANSQATGDLPAVTILPGQSGVPGSGEGTAMLEIVHDLAPGSQLYFASAFNGAASFAQNILDLRAAGCDVIVDDVFYFNESPFQDGIIAQAVNEVTADGALYFSSAGNEGNKNDGTSGTWQGDFVDGGPVAAPISGGGNFHSFGATTYDTVNARGFATVLFWSDPLGAAANDYDLYVLDPAGSAVISSSTTIQSGSQDPYEIVPSSTNGTRIVVVKASGEDRFLHIDTIRGRLAINTDGNVKGHCAAVDAYAVAAVDANTSYPSQFTGGAANPVETFSTDGFRRMFYNADGTPYTPGDFLETGGIVRQKPDIAAADGVQTTVPGFNPFFGTSAAAPHAAAIAALLKSYNPLLTPAQVRVALTNTALDIEEAGFDRDSGSGLIMALAALSATPLPVPVPRFVIATNYIQGGNGNDVIDLNECNNLFLVVSNLGFADATGVSISVSTTTPGVAFGVRTVSYPDMPVGTGATNLIALTMSTAPFFVCGTPIELSVVVKSDQVTAVIPLRIATGSDGVPIRFDSTGPVAIPDLNLIGTNSVIAVSNVATAIRKVTVSLYLPHTYDSDLSLQLIGPDGTTVLLSANNGGSGNNYGVSCAPENFRTTFDDDSGASITGGAPPFVGTFHPQEALAAFIGKTGTNVNGNWTLHVVDSVGIDIGVLECWSLFLSSATCTDGGGTCPGADLRIGMTDVPDPVFIGSNLVYTISITNNGPSEAKGTVINHLLPPSVVFVSAFASQGSVSHSGGTVVANIGNLPFAGKATVTVNVIPTQAGTITSSASVSSNEPDPDTANNSVTITTRVNPPASDIAVGLFDAPDPALVGGALNYAVSVTNNGPSTASGVMVTNTLHVSTPVQSADASQGTVAINGNVVVFNFGTLTNGGRASGNISVTPTATGSISATAVARANQSDPVLANNTATATTVVGPAADLVLTMTDSPDPVVAGSNWVYTITVTNRGPSTANNVVINQTISDPVNIVSTSASTGNLVVSGSSIATTLPSLASGAGVAISVTVNYATNGTVFSSATAAAAETDTNLADNNASVSTLIAAPFVTVVAAGATLTAESVSPADGAISVGETVTVQLRLRNAGNVTSTAVTATLLATNGVISPSGTGLSYGALAAGGASAFQTFTFTASGTNGGTIAATLQVFTNGVFHTNVAFNFVLPTVRSFANTNLILIAENPNMIGAGAPYPSTINVTGVTGLVGKVTVTLSNLNHTYPDDIDMLLVGPTGQKVILMSDVGGGNGLANVILTFDDASSALSDEGQMVSTSYHPTDFESGDAFDSPAPAGPYSSSLSAFAGLSANGTWSLYIMDDSIGDKGSISNGWSLTFNSITPVNQVADLGLIAKAVPSPGLIGSMLTTTFTVTNTGPNAAAGVMLTNIVPPNATLVSAVVSQGSVSTNDSTAIASIGSLNSGSFATLTVVLLPGIGSLTNSTVGVVISPASVGTTDTDLNPGNNSVAAVAVVNLPVADVAVSQSVVTNVITLGSNVTFAVTVTNLGPQAALDVVITDPLPAGFNFVSTTATSFTNAANNLTISLGNLASGSASSFSITATAAAAGFRTNTVSALTSSTDANPANNSAAVALSIFAPAPSMIAAGKVITSESGTVNGAVDLGETVTVSLSLQNVGVIPTTNLRATLLAAGSVAPLSGPQNYGAVAAAGGSGTASFTFTASGVSGGAVVATLSLKDEKPSGTNDLGTVDFVFNLPGTVSFTNAAAIAIPASGPATPYPSTITVSGVTGVVNQATVRLNGFTHSFPDDVDVLLVSPSGQKVILMSDAGGGHTVSNLSLTFSDGSAALPDSSALSSSTYAPTDFETNADTFPSPAPAGTSATALAASKGGRPNGDWSLYVVDDTTGDAGIISGGWTLTLSTISVVNPLADLVISVSAASDAGAPNPPYVGSALIYTIGVINNGPDAATGISVTDNLPAGLTYVSSTISQGSIATNGPIIWTVGSLSVGSGATATIRTATTTGGSIVNAAAVAGDSSQVDLNTANNTAQVTTAVRVPTKAAFSDLVVTNSQLQFTLTGDAGISYRILASTNLTAWTALSTNTAAGNGTIKFTDTAVPAYSRRFYRAERLVP